MTSIQKFLGHKKLNTTMIYARAYDQNVEQDYFAAMGRIEQRMELVGQPAETREPVNESERGQLLVMAQQLAEPQVSQEARLALVGLMLGLLNRNATAQVVKAESPIRGEWIPPPDASVVAHTETA